ncbi:MAG: MFS transporter [Cyanobacteria bacterium P01_A01_bin.114]
MSVFSSFSPALRRNLAVLFMAGLCFWAGLAGLLPSLPLYIETFGANGQQIGFVMASFGVGLLAARPMMARLTDQRGRKPVMMIGLGAIAAAPLSYLLIQFLPTMVWDGAVLGQPLSVSSPVVLLMVFRAFHGLSIAAFVTAYSALVADLAPPENRGELIGYMSLVNPIGMALGPALGGYLYDLSGFTAVFLVMSAVGTLGFMGVLSSREPDPVLGQTVATANRKFWALLWTPPIRIPALMLLLVGLAFGSLATFIPLYARESHLDVNVGLIYTASAMASFAVRLPAGKASDRFGRGRFISIGLIFYTVSMAVLWLAHSVPMVLLAGALQGAGGGTLIPMVAALMADRSAPGERGLMFGLCLTGFDVGISLSGPLMGWVADLSSYRDIFALAGAMTLLGLIIFITTSSKDLAHSMRFALGRGRDVYAIARRSA